MKLSIFLALSISIYSAHRALSAEIECDDKCRERNYFGVGVAGSKYEHADCTFCTNEGGKNCYPQESDNPNYRCKKTAIINRYKPIVCKVKCGDGTAPAKEVEFVMDGGMFEWITGSNRYACIAPQE